MWGAGGRGQGCGGDRTLLVHVALDAEEVLAIAVHLVILPLALVLVRLGATVLAMPIVHVRLPVALVGVAARKRELARAGALVVLPVPGVHGAALVADLALAVPEKAGDLIFGLCTRGGQRGA